MLRSGEVWLFPSALGAEAREFKSRLRNQILKRNIMIITVGKKKFKQHSISELGDFCGPLGDFKRIIDGLHEKYGPDVNFQVDAGRIAADFLILEDVTNATKKR